MKEQGKNEKTRLVDISDPSASDLDTAFHNMWAIASSTRCTKPLHHISINPMQGERLTDKQVLAIVARCEEKYGYGMFHHQRVIVEHIKDGRQHFHVIWNRVSLMTGRPVWPGEHWKKSKQVCREMEQELGLQRPTPRRAQPAHGGRGTASGRYRSLSAGQSGKNWNPPLKIGSHPFVRPSPTKPYRPSPMPSFPAWLNHRRKQDTTATPRFRTPEQELAELIAWAFENGRLDVLAACGINLPPDYFEP